MATFDSSGTKKTLRKTATVTGGFGNVPSTVNAAGNASPYAGQSIAVNSSGTGGTPSGQPGYTDPYSAAYGQFQTMLGGVTNSANTGYGNTLADSFANEGTGALDLGATLNARAAGTDPSAATQGYFDWNGVEATNPFSKAALLVRNYKQQQGRTTNSLAAMGQFNSGARLNQQSEDTFGFQGGQDQLQKALESYLTGQSRTRRDAGTTRDTTINQAGLTGLGSLLGS